MRRLFTLLLLLGCLSVSAQQDMLFDRLPMFPTGMDGCTEYVQGQLKVPEDARGQGVKGKVRVSFYVVEDGSVKDARVIGNEVEGGGKLPVSCEEEAVRVVSGMPKWIPATREGQPAAFELSLPVEFDLTAQHPAKGKKGKAHKERKRRGNE